MTDPDLPYKHSLHDLESLLARVDRPGDFCMHGALGLPLPRPCRLLRALSWSRSAVLSSPQTTSRWASSRASSAAAWSSRCFRTKWCETTQSATAFQTRGLRSGRFSSLGLDAALTGVSTGRPFGRGSLRTTEAQCKTSATCSYRSSLMTWLTDTRA